jgi:tetratricopeptide (TPR) repeat protein
MGREAKFWTLEDGGCGVAGKHLGGRAMRGRWLVFLLGSVMAWAAEEPLADAAGWRAEARERFGAGDYAGTIDAAEAGLKLWSAQYGDPVVRAGLLQWAGVGAESLGETAAARARLEEALALYRAAGARREVAATLNSLAAVYARQVDRRAQLEALVEAHAIFEELGEGGAGQLLGQLFRGSGRAGEGLELP